MNKKNIKILIIVLSLIILIIFSFAFEFSPPIKEREVGKLEPKIESKLLPEENVKVSLDLQDKKYNTEVKEGSTVFEVMQNLKEENKQPDSFDFKYTQHPGLGIFINEINKKSGGKDGYWIYYVNGKEASVGVSNYKIKNGDIISWKYEK